MRMETLIEYGVEPEVVEIWKKKYGENLLPVQKKAICEYGILNGWNKNLIVLSPTSSGKTFIGEMLCIYWARRKERSFYLVPTRALAEEKALNFNEKYGRLGIRVVLSTHEHREFDSQILCGEFEVGILIYEKLLSLLIRKPSLLSEVKFVVIDELQILEDKERGGELEMLLLRMKKEKVSILGLSAFLSRIKEIAEWLSCEILEEKDRPVELRKGIFFIRESNPKSLGVFHYIEHNTGSIKEEIFGVREWYPHSLVSLPLHERLLIGLATYLAFEKKEKTILFVRDKERAERYALIASEISNSLYSTFSISELEETEERKILEGVIKKKVGIHHADLTHSERIFVENEFRAGEIFLLVATSTLSLGMNLPCKNVVLDSKKWNSFNFVDLTKCEYENMGGRGARLGLCGSFGRAILVVPFEWRALRYFDFYCKGGFSEEIKLKWKEGKIRDWTIRLIAGGTCKTKDEILNFISDSYTLKNSTESSLSFVESAIEKGISGNLLNRREGQILITEMGKVMAERGISLETAFSMQNLMRIPEILQSRLLIFFFLAGTDDGKKIKIQLSQNEIKSGIWRREFFRILENMSYQEKTAEFKNLSGFDRMAKISLLLLEWIGKVETREIEERFIAHAGRIKKCAEEMARLVSAFCGFLRAENIVDRCNLEEIGEMLVFGCPKEGLELARFLYQDCRIGRTHLLRLLKEGYDTPLAILEADSCNLEKILPSGIVYKIKELGKKTGFPIDSRLSRCNIGTGMTEKIVLSLDTNSMTVRFREKIKIFPQKTFSFLLLLAKNPGKFLRRDEIYSSLWGDKSSVYDNQLGDHKWKITKFLGENIIEVRRKVGYRLVLRKDEIEIK